MSFFGHEKSSQLIIVEDCTHEIIRFWSENFTSCSYKIRTYREDIGGELVGWIIGEGQLTDSSGWLVGGGVWEHILFDVHVLVTPEEGSLVHVLFDVVGGVIIVTEAEAEVSVKVDFEGINVSVLIPVTFFSKDLNISHVSVTATFLEFPLGEEPFGLFRCKVFTLCKGKACDNSN